MPQVIRVRAYLLDLLLLSRGELVLLHGSGGLLLPHVGRVCGGSEASARKGPRGRRCKTGERRGTLHRVLVRKSTKGDLFCTRGEDRHGAGQGSDSSACCWEHRIEPNLTLEFKNWVK